MKKLTLLLIIIFYISCNQLSFSQNVKFGKVSTEELEEKFYPLDSSANAVILYKKRTTYYEYSGTEGWQLFTRIHQRIKLYNKDGFDWATKEIKLYTGKNGDENANIKGYTYTLENNKTVKTKLKSNGIFDEKISDNWRKRKFTLPNLKEGCIVEWQYTISSPYYSNIDDVIFQYKIPMKYMESKVKIPEYFKFKYLPNVYYPVKVNISENYRKINFIYREGGFDASSISGGNNRTKSTTASVELQEKIYESIEKNIPAIKDEPYVNNINNYRSKIVFEFTAYTPKYGTPKYFNTTWEDVTKTIYNSSNFGGQLKKSPYQQDLTSLNKGNTNEKIVSIYEFVKSKIKWNGNYSKYTQNGIRKAYKEGVGNVADVNLTLVAILRDAGINANPVLVSTRSHGIPLFPTSEGFNYVIAAIEMANGYLLLDATDYYATPNSLPLRALNWQGRLVRKNGTSESINLFPTKKSVKSSFINYEINEDGFIQGTQRTSFSDLFARNYREKKANVSEDDIISNLEKDNNIEISEIKISNKKNPYKNLIELIKFESEDLTEAIGDKIYVNPLLHLTEKTNPFKLDERKFPIDFATPWEDKINIKLKIPDGYKVESLPEKIGLALPDDIGSIRFLISTKDNQVQIVYSMKINTPLIAPTYYSSLKKFYEEIIKKQSEKIVLSKI